MKGYECEKGKFVVLKEDFRRADIEATQSVEIMDFVKFEEIDPMFFDVIAIYGSRRFWVVGGQKGRGSREGKRQVNCGLWRFPIGCGVRATRTFRAAHSGSRSKNSLDRVEASLGSLSCFSPLSGGGDAGSEGIDHFPAIPALK